MIENLLKEMTIREKVGQLNQRLYGLRVASLRKSKWKNRID